MTKIEELVKLVEELPHKGDREWWLGTPWGEIDRRCFHIIDIAREALPELRTLRWIPVEERLPEEYVLVEVVVNGEAGEDRWFAAYDAERRLWRDEVVEGNDAHNVTHWREKTPGPEGCES